MSNVDYTDRECSVYVGNLDKRVTEEILWELFLQAGPLERVSIPKDKETGVQRGFGFVGFTSPVSVNYASNLLDGVSLYGQKIIVKPQNNGSPALNQGNRSSPPMSFIVEQSRHSPIPQYHGMPNNISNSFMGNSQRQETNSYRSNYSQESPRHHQRGRYADASPPFGNLTPNLKQQQHSSWLYHCKNRRY